MGHHFASPGNPFWWLLHAAGLTPELLPPADDRRLLELGLGLTNVCPRATRGAAELTWRDYERGVAELVLKVEAARPAVVALVGVTLGADCAPGEPGGGTGAARHGNRRRAGLRAAQPERSERGVPELRAEARVVRQVEGVRGSTSGRSAGSASAS